MAARLNPAHSPPELVDLRRLTARDLDVLLDEETAEWRDELDWDFGKSAVLVRRFVDLHALAGSAVVEDGEAVAYLYYVLEDNKGLVGDLYVRRGHRGRGHEDALLEAALPDIREHPQINRVESQLLLLDFAPGRALPFASEAAEYDRNFMRAELASADTREGNVRAPIFIERWSGQYHDGAAQVIADAYSGHVDSRVNDQYRSAAGARRFLFNIVQFPGCGTFFQPASYAAFDAITGRLCGISLASMVAPACGHITQICVSSAVRGKGVGHELLRRSLMTLKEADCRGVCLTVTAANEGAVALYERVGFRTIRRFSAYAWEWPAPARSPI
jgi:ribosomal protein S18 acetylase RimI-like enzyme